MGDDKQVGLVRSAYAHHEFETCFGSKVPDGPSHLSKLAAQGIEPHKHFLTLEIREGGKGECLH